MQGTAIMGGEIWRWVKEKEKKQKENHSNWGWWSKGVGRDRLKMFIIRELGRARD